MTNKTAKQKIISKLTSRKFIIAAITAVAGLVTLFTGENETVQIIAGAAMTVIPAAVYCIMEGTVDAASVKAVADATATAAERLGAGKETVGVINNAGAVAGIIADSGDADSGDAGDGDTDSGDTAGGE